MSEKHCSRCKNKIAPGEITYRVSPGVLCTPCGLAWGEYLKNLAARGWVAFMGKDENEVSV